MKAGADVVIMQFFSTLARFWRSGKGNVTIVFSIALPVIIGSIAVSVDISNLYMRRAELQGAADSAALAAAKELYMAGADQKVIAAVAENYARTNIGTGRKLKIGTTLIDDDTAVTVEIVEETKLYFASFLVSELSPIHVSATARAAGGGRICVVGLAETDEHTVLLDFSAKLTAPTCAVYSNSMSKYGLVTFLKSTIEAELICSSGGYSGKDASFQPSPIVDCPQLQDPLSDRKAPSYSGCDYKDFKVSAGDVTIYPGVYCGGLTIGGTANVFAQPGVYVISGAPFGVLDEAKLRGEYVGFHLVKGSKIHFMRDTTIDLGAPKSGPMAGILIYEGPVDGNTYSDDDDDEDDNERKFSTANFLSALSITHNPNQHEIRSNNARNLLGTIYLPHSKLFIHGENKIADKSAYTAIIVRQLEMRSGPDLHLNTNYTSTDVPVPEGITPVGRNVFLER